MGQCGIPAWLVLTTELKYLPDAGMLLRSCFSVSLIVYLSSVSSYSRPKVTPPFSRYLAAVLMIRSLLPWVSSLVSGQGQDFRVNCLSVPGEYSKEKKAVWGMGLWSAFALLTSSCSFIVKIDEFEHCLAKTEEFTFCFQVQNCKSLCKRFILILLQ